MKYFSTYRFFLFSTLLFIACSFSLQAAKNHKYINPPLNLIVTPASGSSVLLTWTDESTDETQFEVERKQGSTGSYILVASLGMNVTRYVNDNLSPEITYYYRVRAINATGASVYSNENSIKLPDVTIPEQVRVNRDGKEPGLPIERQYTLSQLTEGNQYEVFPVPPCLDGNYYVGWQLYYDLGDLNTQNTWTGYLEITLLKGTTALWTKHLQVETGTQTFIATIFHQDAISCDGSYTFKIARKTLTGTVPQSNVYLKEFLYKQYSDVFNPGATIDLSYNISAPMAQITWTYQGKGAIAYDIEWVYISGQETFTGTTAQDAFNFKEPVRITTAANYYKHSMFYPDGKVWIRARAVGYNPTYPEHRINGVWQYGAGTPLLVSNGQADLNWQLQTSFVEEGKYKKLINYYDGSLRLRQTLTNLSTDQRTVVAEQYYDYEGRKSLDVLPVPLEGNSLAYKNNLNVFTSSNPLITQNTSTIRKKYHYDNGSEENSTLASTSGAGQYFSLANTLTMPNKDYLPSANGYAYTQTEFSRDNTGKVVNQSGLGETFKADGSHTTRIYHGSAAPAELIRLFGSNIGNASHYKKNMIVDPNGQVSVTYLDQEGRNIATSLAGEKPENLEALESYNNLASVPVTIDISSKNKKTTDISRITHKILNVSPNTNYQFQFQLTALASQLETIGCQACSFDLKITITSPKGTPLNLSALAGNQSSDGLSYQKNDLKATDCTNAALLEDLNFSLVLSEVGDYTITKEVIPQELSFVEVKEVLKQNTSIQEKITQIQNSYTEDPSQCEICVSNCEGAEEEIQHTINEIASLDCENIKQNIIQDILKVKGPTYEVTENDIAAHVQFCQYQICIKDKQSDVFDKQLSLVTDWTTAVSKGLSTAINLDPFFNSPYLSGVNHKNSLQSKLDAIHIANIPYDDNGDGNADGSNTFAGTILAATDPANTNFYVGTNGKPDPVYGRHLLYWDLMGKKTSLPVEEYNKKLNEQRWMIFRNLYLEAKRKTKLEIPALTACQPYLQELQRTDELPTTENEIASWGESQQISGPVSEEQLEMNIANISASCNTQFSDTDKLAITSHLRTYFNANPKNFFRLIIKEELTTNADLVAIGQILASYNCSLDKTALSNPLLCKTDTVITVPAPIYCPDCITPSSDMQTNSLSVESSGQNKNSNLLNHISQQSLTAQQEQIWEAERNAFVEKESEKWLKVIKDKIAADKEKNLKKQSQISVSSSTMSTAQTTATLPSQSEYDALLALYNATNGPNWTNKTGWQNAVPGVVQDVSGWYGVSIDANGRITQLSLYNNNLNGSIPPSIGNLINLELLYLNSNQLSGSIPASLGNLINLQLIHLNHNQLTGPIPTELGNLINLWALGLNFNQLSGSIPASLGNLINLKQLSLYNNQLTGSIPTELGNLINLEHLYLTSNQLSGSIPTSLGNLVNLKILVLNDNQLTGFIPAELGNLINLEELWLNSNQLSGTIPASFSNLSGSIHTINLYSNQLTGTVPTVLYDPVLIQQIRLHDNYFTFSHLLTHLNNYSSITVYSPQKLVDVPKTIPVVLGITITLTTDIDRSTTPASKFQWFKYVNGVNDIPLIPSPSYNGHTHTIANVQESDLGKFYYRITNEGASQLTLKSHLQEVKLSTVPMRTLSFCLSYDQANPTLSMFNFQVNWGELMEQCMIHQREAIAFMTEVAIERMLEEEATKYYQTFRTSCLDKLSEKLSYTYLNKEYHYTLYYYDQASNLVQTVPPKGVNPLTPAQVSAFMAGTKTEPAHSLLTTYRYNAYNKLVWQQTPDAGISEFYYDTKGQLRLSKNAQQTLNNKYSYTKYDEQGRVMEVGEMTSTESFTQLNLRLDDATFPSASTYTLSDLTRTYYDLPVSGLTDFTQANLRNRVSWVETVNAGDARIATYYSYDIHGNVKSLQQQLPDTSPKRTDYVYDLISGKVNYVMYQYGKADQMMHRYGYDADNRLEKVHTSIDGFLWDKEAEYFYYAHGPLARVETGQYGVQGTDYYYTLQGWLKGVNMPYSGDPGKDGGTGPRIGRDAFSYTLGYYKGDYEPIGSTAILSDTRDQLWTRYKEQMGTDGLYNGNIALMVTDGEEFGKRQGNDRSKGMMGMLFGYDQLNRITSSKSLATYTAGSGFAARSATDAPYDTRYSYDANGNLLNLLRRDAQSALQDDLRYQYYPGTNRLMSAANQVQPPVYEEKIYSSGPVTSDGKIYKRIIFENTAYVASGNQVKLNPTESATMKDGFTVQSGADFEVSIKPAGAQQDADNYVYDAIGNLIEDKGEGVTIEWTVYGKVRKVTKNDGTVISYRYDGAGNRVEKLVAAAGTTTSTKYIRDASGNVLSTYQDDMLIEQPLYGSSRIGLYKGGRLGGQRRLGTKQYELNDHLGNVHVVLTDNIYLDATSTQAKVVSASDYYPFGLQMAGRNYNSEAYRYGYNGKELDKDFQNNYDYGFRIYNPAIAKFLSVDPLTRDYAWNSTYAFAENDPINFIDLEGAEKGDPPYKKNNVNFVQLFNPWVSPILRKDGQTFTQTAIQMNTANKIEYTINAQQYEKAATLVNPFSAGNNSDWQAQGRTVYQGEILIGRSSTFTFYASTKNNVVSFGQGDAPSDADFAIGGGIPLIINGLKYGATNIYAEGAPEGLPFVGDPGAANRKYLVQRSNAGYPKQDNITVGKAILAYNSAKKSTMLVAQQDGTAGMTLTQIRDYLIGLGYDNAISFDGSSSATLVKDNSTMVKPSDVKDNTIPSGVTFTVEPNK